jgi:3-carboxy-cis,cis-muconate cycloisomerase
MAGRTLLQQAVPITFGVKAAGWLSGLDDAVDLLGRVASTRLAVQLGGAAGTRSALSPHGAAVAAALADELGLVAAVPWHTNRVRVAELAGALGATAAALAKPARDVILLAQTEVGEVREGSPGRGGSSAMPQKRNPVAAIATVAAAAAAPGLVATLLAAAAGGEHERAAGAGQTEWTALRRLLVGVGSAAAWLADCLAHLEVDPERMRANLDLTGGAVTAERIAVALAGRVGRTEAHRAVARAMAARRPLVDVLREDAELAGHLDGLDLDDLADPAGDPDAGGDIIDTALWRHHSGRKPCNEAP